MASLATSGGSTLGSGGRQIPLLCSVCPEAPRFSDVSHLLTHIASKGHLHHETQTRLKRNQDLASLALLEQYEQWYRDNGIEALLVERMKAKQQKEAAKARRVRGAALAPANKSKRKTKRRSPNSTSATPAREAKLEQGDYIPDFALFPGFLPSENDVDNQDDVFVSTDMLALKGQVWPGMGKMDLANEDMKRTRNQRKPNSVIDKMRRTSEGIEPTQVVMTPDFEVERIKGVYDSSSPIPGQEEETPKKVIKPKRKRSEVLADVSVNVPRGGNRRSTRLSLASTNSSNSHKIKHLKLEYDRDTSSDLTPSLGAFRHSHDIFRDDDGCHDRSFATPTHREPKFDTRERLSMHSLNPMSHSIVVSPTPSSREVSARILSARSRGPPRANLGHGGPLSLGGMSQPETVYGLADASMFGPPTRLAFAASPYNSLSQDGYRLLPSHLQAKQEDYSSTSSDSLSGSNNGSFLSMAETNPLFSQDRVFLPPYHPSNTNPSLSSMSFTPINRVQDHGHGSHDHDHRPQLPDIKLENHICDGIESSTCTEKQGGLSMHAMWDSHGPGSGVGIRPELNDDEIDL
ncbi:hypothetical protein CDD82_5454 [Ophiocordyceps australis]|uniref:Uncharacterized protein n=1 Tax=Ophiocordyceps australis TaxID=1399860 RepID=A0A2C5ZRZ7_9HYPO|nr:hypothetical protein CDD82_5454 [Ophiocordyceps australis]